MHLIILPTHSRWLKVARNRVAFVKRSAVKRHRKWIHLEALEFRGSSSSRIVASMYGHFSRLDDVAADQDAISSISSAMQRPSACPAETAKPYRVSDLIPKSWDGSHDEGQFRNFMAELHLWMQAWSD